MQSYAEHFDLKRFIHFNTIVKNVTPLESSKWKVESMNLESGVRKEELFDAIMVCSGHYSIPALPSIEGLDKVRFMYKGSKNNKNLKLLNGIVC